MNNIKCVKIAYVNFWKDTDNDKYLSEFIKQFVNIEHVEYNCNPDILISSCNGNFSIDQVAKIDSKIKIFFTGENLNRFPHFNNQKKLHQTFDIILGFNKTDMSKNILRFPLWLIYYSFYSWDDKNNILNFIQKEYETNIRNKKSILSTCIARHDRGGQRSHICNIIENYKPNHSLYPSNFRNNCQKLDLGFNNKKDFLKNVLFSVCPENSSSELYHTEKIFHAFEGGTIPIYWAVDKPEKELISENSYIFCNTDNSDISKIQSAIDNPQKFLNQNIFKPQGKYIIDNYYETLGWRIKQKLDVIPKQKIYGISYASRHFKNRFNNINFEGKNCGFFDNFQCYDETNIDNDFKDKLKDVWNMSTRGGGYWIWKPKIILDKLKKINDNDILVYIDSGCTINNTQTSKMRFNDYINMVNSHWTGFLRFELTHMECDLSNKYSIQYLSDYFNTDFNDYVDSNQLMTTVLVIRKNKFTMDFFSKNLEIVEKNPYIHTDIYTKENEKHHHDQSLMSLLYKHMNGSLILKDETWFGGNTGNFDSINSKKYPFYATRLRN